MEDWRIYALAFSPDLRMDLLDDQTSYYQVFFHLHFILPSLYQRDDSREIKPVFAFAEWCLNHTDDAIVNAVNVAFYEHLFDRREQWEHAASWLDRAISERCWGLWETRRLPGSLDELRALLFNPG